MDGDELLLNRKNTAAVQQTLEQLTEKVYEQQIKVELLQLTISGLCEKINSMEKMLVLQKVALTGTGPSVR